MVVDVAFGETNFFFLQSMVNGIGPWMIRANVSQCPAVMNI